MPTPEERDAMKAEESVEISPEMRALLDEAVKEIDKLRREQLARKLDLHLPTVDAQSKACLCSALYTSAMCPIHGPNYARHLWHRQ